MDLFSDLGCGQPDGGDMVRLLIISGTVLVVMERESDSGCRMVVVCVDDEAVGFWIWLMVYIVVAIVRMVRSEVEMEVVEWNSC